MNSPIYARTSWQDAAAEIRSIREQVFIVEQQVPVDLEWDGKDDNAIHILATIDNKPVGTGRLLSIGQIGRMAVMKDYRGQGIGSEILKQLMDIARTEKISPVYLNAQKQAITFYEKYSFEQTGDYFDDAGIVHCRMIFPS